MCFVFFVYTYLVYTYFHADVFACCVAIAVPLQLCYVLFIVERKSRANQDKFAPQRIWVSVYRVYTLKKTLWISHLFLSFVGVIFRGSSLRRVKNGSSKWRAKEISIDGKPPAFSSAAAVANRNSANLSTADMSPALIAQANWTFVEKLLKVRKSPFYSIFIKN